VRIYDLFPESDLNAQIADKMVKIQYHPTAPLSIANYTQTATFNHERWTHVTDLCRGLIWNTDTLELVARPFCKFWNYSDPQHPETLPENLPTEDPEITRKEDGSLGIIFRNPLSGRYEVATRGSFISEQAVWATEWIKTRQKWIDCGTPLVEIIYPQNRIVVDYKGWSGLKLLAFVNIENGEEAPRFGVEWLARDNDMEATPLYNNLLSVAIDEDRENEEGYVAKWNRVGQPPLRVKIKFGTYRKLHKVLTGTNAIGIWELLRDGKTLDEVFAHTPVEFQSWVKKTESDLLEQFGSIGADAVGDYYARSPVDVERKIFAEYAKTCKYPGLLFALLDGKDLTPMIWKMLRPTGDVRPFKEDES
jgi:RNA ligase